MKLFVGLISAASLCFVAGMANASIITNESFEPGTSVSGWNDNSVTDGGTTFTTFLGRHSGSSNGDQSLFKDFTLSGTQTEVTISFDFYEIDSWDYEDFIVYVDDNEYRRDQYKHNREDAPTGTIDLFGGASSPDTSYGFAGWPDQGVRYSFTIATTSTNFRLGFGATINQGISDESWGIDNVVITDNSIPGSPIPEPATMLLFGSGLAGLVGSRIRKKKKL